MKIKSVLCGVIIGVLLTSGIFAVAEEALSVTPNPFKITVDGEAKNIEGYNINGSTYFKLRDVGNEVGFSVDFKEDTIMIETNIDEAVTSSTNSEYNYILINDIECISASDAQIIVKKYRPHWWLRFFEKNDISCTLGRSEKRENAGYVTVAEYDIPYEMIDDKMYITRETFENEILVRINAE